MPVERLSMRKVREVLRLSVSDRHRVAVCWKIRERLMAGRGGVEDQAAFRQVPPNHGQDGVAIAGGCG